jgi:ubiquinone/menaquinone biosynthesis C-methylase UbiE
MKQNQTPWQQRSAVFHEQADEYDQWFEDSLLFAIELAAIRDLKVKHRSPSLEIGVGPGRFARKLGIDFGLDPAMAPLLLADKRQIAVCRAIGEDLPLADHSLGAVYLLFTLCFLTDPGRVFKETSRCLQPGGNLVLGMVPASGPWGKALREKKENNHPFYRYAEFYEVDDIRNQLARTGLEVVETRSSLRQQPGLIKTMEHSQSGLDDKAGFVVMVAEKRNRC